MQVRATRHQNPGQREVQKPAEVKDFLPNKETAPGRVPPSSSLSWEGMFMGVRKPSCHEEFTRLTINSQRSERNRDRDRTTPDPDGITQPLRQPYNHPLPILRVRN